MDPLEKVRADAERAKLGLRDVAGGRREAPMRRASDAPRTVAESA